MNTLILIVVIIIILILLSFWIYRKLKNEGGLGSYKKYNKEFKMFNDDCSLDKTIKDYVSFGYINKDWLFKKCFCDACFKYADDTGNEADYYFEYNTVDKNDLEFDKMYSVMYNSYQFTFEANENFYSYHWYKSLLSDFHNIINLMENRDYSDDCRYGSFQCCYGKNYADGKDSYYGTKIEDDRTKQKKNKRCM